jgi:aspartate racemase
MDKNESKILGVLGGLGPMATAYYLELMIKMTDAATDQEHLQSIVMNFPTVPDRTAFILGRSEDSPLEPMIALGRQLKEMGATVIATPCITAHYFHQPLQEGIGLPMIHGIECVARQLAEQGITRVGLMATDGTVQSGIFQRQVEAQGMELVLPDEEGQKAVMALIYDQIKAGKPADPALFEKVKQQLRHKGAQAVVLGCTELSLLKKGAYLGTGILDALEVLAQESLIACGKSIKSEYQRLFTPFSRKEF